MIKSMTGYAGSDISTDKLTLTIEIRGYNGRHLDIALKISSRYAMLEDKIKKAISERVARGRVEIKLFIQETSENTDLFRVNESMAAAYHDALVKLKATCQLDEDISLAHLCAKNGIIETADPGINPDDIWPVLEENLQRALSEFDAMKKNEGAALAKDLSDRLNFIENAIHTIETKTDGLLTIYQEKLKARIAALTQGIIDIDPARIAQEAAFIVDRSDISEEIVRAASHLNQFRQLMASPEPAGRSLNFLLQEFNREFNTMGSKAGDTEVAHIIVAVKTELEKIREQIQNVE
jgi:uncharacterized protein (TIGR00255 family)